MSNHPLAFFRGLLFAVAFSTAFWSVLILLLVWRAA